MRVRVWRDGETAIFEIADTGPGIAPAERDDHLRSVPAGDREGGRRGAPGSGLAIARGIAEAHHGTLSVSAGDMGGAAFRLTLPT